MQLLCVNGIIQSLVNNNVHDNVFTCLTYELKFIDFLTWQCFKGIYCLGNCYVIVELHSEWERITRWTTSIMKMKKRLSQWTDLCNCIKRPEKNSGLQRGLNLWLRDTSAMLYQLSYEATDIGSMPIVGSHVLVKEMSVNDKWNKSTSIMFYVFYKMYVCCMVRLL